MDDPTVVGTAREDHGQTTCIQYPVGVLTLFKQLHKTSKRFEFFKQTLLAFHQNIDTTVGDISCRLVFKQDIAESERQIAIAACSRSSIEAVVTTVVPGLVTVDHGAP